MSDQPQTIVVIDDDRYLAEVISASLHIFGAYRVFPALNGKVGLELCAQHHPDLVVVDVNMPHLDGFQVVRALRGDPATSEMPIIILSAQTQVRAHREGLFAGADLYLEKPLKPMELVNAIHNVLQWTPEERLAHMEHLIDMDAFGSLGETF